MSAAPAEPEGLDLFGVEGSRDERSLRFPEGASSESSRLVERAEAGDSAAGRAEVEAMGEPGVLVDSPCCTGGVASGDGELSERLLVRRFMPDS